MVPETTMKTHLLHALHIFTVLVIKLVRDELRVGSVLNIVLSVEEPRGDIEVPGLLKNLDNSVDFLVAEFTSSLVLVNLGLAHGSNGETASNTPNGSNCEGHLSAGG